MAIFDDKSCMQDTKRQTIINKQKIEASVHIKQNFSFLHAQFLIKNCETFLLSAACNITNRQNSVAETFVNHAFSNYEIIILKQGLNFLFGLKLELFLGY
ncbi:unnamed protein product [Clavelina lepadiformis]|uniref:Uncharacterized protein n=1 Tax=Clavelina lepadiformis TaxID=159417 RepID=A0ABP0FQK6_CLALP